MKIVLRIASVEQRAPKILERSQMRSGSVPDFRASTKCVVVQKNLTSDIDRSITRERDPECLECRFTLVEHEEATREIVQQEVHEF